MLINNYCLSWTKLGVIGTAGQKKMQNTPINSNANCCREMNYANQHGLLSTSILYCKIVLKGLSTWGSLPNFNFFSVSLTVIRLRNYN